MFTTIALILFLLIAVAFVANGDQSIALGILLLIFMLLALGSAAAGI